MDTVLKKLLGLTVAMAVAVAFIGCSETKTGETKKVTTETKKETSKTGDGATKADKTEKADKTDKTEKADKKDKTEGMMLKFKEHKEMVKIGKKDEKEVMIHLEDKAGAKTPLKAWVMGDKEKGKITATVTDVESGKNEATVKIMTKDATPGEYTLEVGGTDEKHKGTGTIKIKVE